SNTFFLRNTNTLGIGDIEIVGIGQPGDLPVVGDWDGNGTFTVGLLRPDVPTGSNTLYLWNSNSTPPGPPDVVIVGIGVVGDHPLAGDWTGSGVSSIGLFRANEPSGLNTFFLWNSLPSNPPGAPDQTIAGLGTLGDVGIAGAWDGTGATTIGLFRANEPAGL